MKPFSGPWLRKLGRTIVLIPPFGGFLALWLLWTAQPLILRLVGQPVSGYFLDTSDLHRLVRSATLLTLGLILPWTASYFYYLKVTRRHMTPEELGPRGFVLYGFWGCVAIGFCIMTLPKAIPLLGKLRAEAMPSQGADERATEVVDHLRNKKVADLRNLFPEDFPSAALDPLPDKLREIAGDDVRLEQMKVLHVSAPRTPERPEQGYAREGTVGYKAVLTGNRGSAWLFVFLYRDGSGWRPFHLNLTQPRELRAVSSEGR